MATDGGRRSSKVRFTQARWSHASCNHPASISGRSF